MSRPKSKAVGSRGSWHAHVDGEKLPCIHDKNMRGMEYFGPNSDDDRHRELLNDIKALGKVIMRKSERTADDTSWVGKGYIAVWSVSDARIEDKVMRFRFVDRLIDLQG